MKRIRAKDSERMVKALLNLRHEASLFFEPGVWKLTPGGDLYVYEGGTDRLDRLREAAEQCDGIAIEEEIAI